MNKKRKKLFLILLLSIYRWRICLRISKNGKKNGFVSNTDSNTIVPVKSLDPTTVSCLKNDLIQHLLLESANGKRSGVVVVMYWCVRFELFPTVMALELNRFGGMAYSRGRTEKRYLRPLPVIIFFCGT